jgi:hypothetical protein
VSLCVSKFLPIARKNLRVVTFLQRPEVFFPRSEYGACNYEP